MTSVSSPFPVPKTSVNRPSSQAGIPFTSALSADLPLQPAMMPFHANAGKFFLAVLLVITVDDVIYGASYFLFYLCGFIS